MFNRNLTMRIDEQTDLLLKVLINDLSFNKSQVIRRSLKLMKDLIELQKQYGDIKFKVGEREVFLFVN